MQARDAQQGGRTQPEATHAARQEEALGTLLLVERHQDQAVERGDDRPATVRCQRLAAADRLKAELLTEQRARTSALEQARGIIVRHVFHRDGLPIRDFRRAWMSACQAAGVPGRLVHDFRRTAARNFSRAGVSERVIMAPCGWKTRSVFDRYRIVNEADLAEGLAKLARLGGTAERAPRKVVRMRTGTVRAQA